ncbi:MAG TPA: hypothetical protein VFS24_13155 [Steroidobacteraceae bacterium]|nr:hypothetical protein [Steroidobacteraceae bacterium]
MSRLKISCPTHHSNTVHYNPNALVVHAFAHTLNVLRERVVPNTWASGVYATRAPRGDGVQHWWIQAMTVLVTV